jgi:hypothetical protein
MILFTNSGAQYSRIKGSPNTIVIDVPTEAPFIRGGGIVASSATTRSETVSKR